MSKEGMEGFAKYLMENKECQAKVKGFGDDADAFAAYARELGYEFSAEELREYKEKTRELLKSKVLKFQPPDAAKSPGARAFYDLVQLAETDDGVAKELAALDMESPEEIITFGKAKGFVFTKEDMKAVSKDIIEQEDELSDEELEAAAGGIVLFALLVSMAVAGVVVAGSVAVGGAVAIGVVAVACEAF